MKNQIYFLIILCWFNTSIGQTVTTIAGAAGLSGSTNGPTMVARFSYPNGLAVDALGNVYVADPGNTNSLRKITKATGIVSNIKPYSVEGIFDDIRSVTIDNLGNVYIVDYLNNTIGKITPSGVITILAGARSQAGGTNDGTGFEARFYRPEGLAVDVSGNVYVSDTGNNAIRKITPAGVVTTLAGLPGLSTGGFVNGIGATARFNFPTGIAVDAFGNVYVADTGNNAIRKITASGMVTTLAGSSSSVSGNVNGTGTTARFNYPSGVAVDASGNVYVADTDNNAIRKITSTGVVSSLAGKVNGSSSSANGIGSAAGFNRPKGIAVDDLGDVYVSDTNNHTIRKITGVLSNANFKTDLNLKIYPNPTTSLLQIQTPNSILIDKVIIVDLTGKKVLEQTKNTTQVDVAHLAKETYIIEVFSGEEKFSSKFIKE